jgi:hypothetical protein
MYQKNHVIYLHPKHCPTRDQEVIMEDLSHKSNRPEAPGLAKELGKLADLITEKPKLETPVHLCLLSLDEAFMRRGMAFHVVGIMNWTTHEKTRRLLMEALRETTVRDDEVAISYEDVITCDKQIFVMINHICEDGIRPGPKGLPIDLCIDEVLKHRKIDRMLRTRIGKTGSAPAKRDASPAGTSNTERNRAKRARQAASKKKTAAELNTLRQNASGGGDGKRKRGKKGKGWDDSWNDSSTTPPPPPPPAPKGDRGGKGGKGGKGKGGKGGKGAKGQGKA